MMRVKKFTFQQLKVLPSSLFCHQPQKPDPMFQILTSKKEKESIFHKLHTKLSPKNQKQE